jgi:hypothetical protein
MRARRLRMPVIRPVCLDLDETTKNTGTTTTRTVAAGSVETRVTTTWTHGMTNGAETCRERVCSLASRVADVLESHMYV